MLHEVHNELEPTPDELAKLIGDWVLERVPSSTVTSEMTGQGEIASSQVGVATKAQL